MFYDSLLAISKNETGDDKVDYNVDGVSETSPD
jgi:hypothetical protein